MTDQKQLLDAQWESFKAEIYRLANSRPELQKHLEIFRQDGRALYADNFSERRLIIQLEMGD